MGFELRLGLYIRALHELYDAGHNVWKTKNIDLLARWFMGEVSQDFLDSHFAFGVETPDGQAVGFFPTEEEHQVYFVDKWLNSPPGCDRYAREQADVRIQKLVEDRGGRQ